MTRAKLIAFAARFGLQHGAMEELVGLVAELIDDNRNQSVLSLLSELAPGLASHASLSLQGTTTVEPNAAPPSPPAEPSSKHTTADPPRDSATPPPPGTPGLESTQNLHIQAPNPPASDPDDDDSAEESPSSAESQPHSDSTDESHSGRRHRRLQAVNPAPPLPLRYRDLGLLGLGGMGEVRRVLDRDLNRTVAMKVIAGHLMEKPSSLARFVEEAQVSAQLEHPAIIPVHEIGRLPDGRLYFTMQEIRGRTMSKVIREVHRGGGTSAIEAISSLGAWTLRRLLGAFLRVCEAVAYGHSRGVIHRDLKPSNVMLGRNGEVTVVDWGIAKVLGRGVGEASREEDDVSPVQNRKGHPTLRGVVTGTPAYMPPEQALGQTDRIDARSDVYALGAILYEILCGQAPYKGLTGKQLLFEVIQRPPAPVVKLATRPLPAGLVEICERAMQREPDDRYQDARAIAKAINDWLEGIDRRERAMTLVNAANDANARADALRNSAADLRAQARTLLADVSPDDDESRKAAGWALEDDAHALERQASMLRLESEQRLQSALSHDPELIEAHAALSSRYAEEHRAAEANNDHDEASRAEVYLRAHAQALPEHNPTRRRHLAYLQGVGSLSLLTDPPGAEVHLHRYEVRRRRLIPVFDCVLGKTPLRDMLLGTGAYLLTLHKPGHVPVRYPVLIERLGHWDGKPTPDAQPCPIHLPTQDALGPDEIYVPDGWFFAGGDPQAPGSIQRQKLWRDAFIIKKFPVSNREYLAFLNDLVRCDQVIEALRHAPRERAGTAGEEGALIYGFNELGRFHLRPDGSGDPWYADEPVRMIDWFGAVAFSRWLSDQENHAWRLPSEWEWEKAARGVDARAFPWGDFLDPSWCVMHDSHLERPMPVDSFPVDESPYGVRGLAGNVSDWCSDLYRRNPHDSLASLDDVSPGWVARGGDWSRDESYCRAAHRAHYQPFHRSHQLGFRLVRSLC